MEFKIRIEDAIGSRAKQLADDLDTSFNQYVCDLIERDLTRHAAERYADLWYARTHPESTIDSKDQNQ